LEAGGAGDGGNFDNSGAGPLGLKRVAFDRPHATRFRLLFYACRYRKTAAHPRFKPEGMLLRDMH
jgi:hypothetical protein